MNDTIKPESRDFWQDSGSESGSSDGSSIVEPYDASLSYVTPLSYHTLLPCDMLPSYDEGSSPASRGQDKQIRGCRDKEGVWAHG